MKTNLRILIAVILVAAFSRCAKQTVTPAPRPSTEEINAQYQIDYGTAVFWTKIQGAGILDVTIGKTTFQTCYVTDTAPSCGTGGYATFSLPIGTHIYKITGSTTTKTWTGEVTVSIDHCEAVQVK